MIRVMLSKSPKLLLVHTCIDVNIEETSYVGLHLFCSISRHILPSAYTIICMSIYKLRLPAVTQGLTIGMKHFGNESDHWGFIGVLFTELHGEFESAIFKWCVLGAVEMILISLIPIVVCVVHLPKYYCIPKHYVIVSGCSTHTSWRVLL